MKKKMILLVTSVLILFGCGDEFCPGFPKEYEDYLPYEKGQILRFDNGKNDTIAYEIQYIDISKDQYVSRYGKYGCTATPYKSFGSFAIGENKISAELNYVIYSVGKEKLDTQVAFIYGYSKVSDILEKKLFEATTDFITIINEREIINRITKVKILKGKGIISFYDKELDCEWTLVESNKSH